jgi:hypothetical protein
MANLIAAVAASAPLRVRKIVYLDPVLTLVGDDWSLSLRCPWQLRHSGAVLTTWDRDDAEDVAAGLVGASIESASYARSGNPKDPAFQISGGLSLEVAADTDLDPWVMRVPGGIFVGGVTS